MNKTEKAARIAKILDDLFPMPDIPLDHGDPFTLLVAVVLSAQTTDARVNIVTPGLFALASTPEAMARLSVEQILEKIRTCGLAPGKAKNIKRLSELLVERHGGRVPADMEALEALPGVGHKTASVVMGQAFGVPAFPVDTHIHRLAARWKLSNGKNVEQTERDLKRVFPESTWGKVHLQIIYFGRTHCPALRHDEDACPICSWASKRETRNAKREPETAKSRGAAPTRRKLAHKR
jgi:endonuclease-3